MFQRAFDVEMKRIKEELDAGKKLFLLDVREEEEYAQGHLPSAMLLPLSKLREQMEKIPKDRPVYVYCRSGQRSQSAKRLLQEAGYQQVYNIGGIIYWPYDIEN